MVRGVFSDFALLLGAVMASATTSSSSSSIHARNKMVHKRDYDPFRQTSFTNAEIGIIHPDLGGCGYYNNDQSLVITLSKLQYGDGQRCNQYIEIVYNGKSAKGQVADSCLSCPDGQLLLSPALFAQLEDVTSDYQTIVANWSYV